MCLSILHNNDTLWFPYYRRHLCFIVLVGWFQWVITDLRLWDTRNTCVMDAMAEIVVAIIGDADDVAAAHWTNLGLQEPLA